MVRPRRLYINSSGKYYYLIDGKKKFIKVPEGMSQKQVQTINIKNIIGETGRRIKRKKKKRRVRYTKKVTKDDMQESPGLPTYIFQPKKKILSLSEIAEGANTNTDSKLINLLEKALMVNKPSVKADAETQTIGIPPVEKSSGKAKRGSARSQRQEREQEKIMKDFNKAVAENKKKLEAELMARTRSRVADESKEMFPGENIGIQESKESPEPTPIKRTGKSKVVKVVSPEPTGTTPLTNRPASRFTPRGVPVSPETPGAERLRKPPLPAEARGKTKGKGFDEVDEGLYNDEIERIMKKRLKGLTVPVVAADEVDTLPNHLYNKDFFAAVINTDPSNSGGRHWRCIVVDNRDDFPSAEYFDSLAETEKPEPALLDVMRKICRLMNPEKYMKYKFSKIRRQSYNKGNCGYHVMKFIEDRYNGIPFEEASGYKDYMKGRGSAPDDSQDGEGDLASYERKIKREFKEYL